MKTIEKVLISVATIMFILYVGFYVFHFRNARISTDANDWGAFADYLNPIIGVLNLIILIILSISVRRSEEERYRFEKKFIEAAEKPILIFWDNAEQNSWFIKNIGKGAALNLYVSYNTDDNPRQSIVKCYSIASGEEKKLIWIRNAYNLIASYQDLHHNFYIAKCQDDLTEHIENEDYFGISKNQAIRYNEKVTEYNAQVMQKQFEFAQRVNS